MPSNFTENYQLSQWEASDDVLRADFNADNAKIDTALAAIWDSVPYVKLLEVTTQANAPSVNLDVSGVDFLAYRRIEVYCSCASLNSTVTVQVNGQTSGYKYGGTSGGSSSYGELKNLAILGCLTLFYPPTQGDRVGCAYFTGNGYSFGGQQAIADCTWENLNSIQFSMYNGIPAGTKIIIYGLKK